MLRSGREQERKRGENQGEFLKDRSFREQRNAYSIHPGACPLPFGIVP